MSERSEAEWNQIAIQGWFQAVRDYSAVIFGYFRDNAITVEGELHFEVWDVPVEVRQILPDVREAVIQAGKNDDGSPLFEWRVPMNWLLPPS